jgi:hypothetical protein
LGRLLLIIAAVLSEVLWAQQGWIAAFPSDVSAETGVNSSGRFYLLGLAAAFIVVLAADLRYNAAPNKTFGLAGILWFAAIGLLIASAFLSSHSLGAASVAPRSTRWSISEIVLVAAWLLIGLVTRVWNLTNFPENIYPDEIMTGTVAAQAYITPTGPSPSVFSTLWSEIDLPALWFWVVAISLKLGGNSLAMLRLPAALFGAATVLTLYALAVPVGAWATLVKTELSIRRRWMLPVTLAIGMVALGWSNLRFYFHRYYADPESLKSNAYRSAQQNYEVQTAQSRYMASLGHDYQVFTVGQSSFPYDPETTRYLVPGQTWTLLTNPTAELRSANRDSKGTCVFVFLRERPISQFNPRAFPRGQGWER